MKRNSGHNRFVGSLLAGAAVFALASTGTASANDLRIGKYQPVSLSLPGNTSPVLNAPVSVQTAPNIVVNLEGLDGGATAPAKTGTMAPGRRVLLMPGRDSAPAHEMAAAGASGASPLRIESDSGVIQLLPPELIKKRKKKKVRKPVVKKPVVEEITVEETPPAPAPEKPATVPVEEPVVEEKPEVAAPAEEKTVAPVVEEQAAPAVANVEDVAPVDEPAPSALPEESTETTENAKTEAPEEVPVAENTPIETPTVAEDKSGEGDDISDTLGEPGQEPETDIAASESVPEQATIADIREAEESVAKDQPVVSGATDAVDAVDQSPVEEATETAQDTVAAAEPQPAPLPVTKTGQPVTADEPSEEVVADTVESIAESAPTAETADTVTETATAITETPNAAETVEETIEETIEETVETATESPAIAVPKNVPNVAEGGPRPLVTEGEAVAAAPAALPETGSTSEAPAQADEPAEAASLAPAGTAKDVLPSVFDGPDGLERLVFSADEATISDVSQQRLQDIATWAKAEGSRLRLLAYANDSENRSQAARRLALSRALVVRSQLIELGVDSAMIEVRALGISDDQGPGDRVDIQALLTQ